MPMVLPHKICSVVLIVGLAVSRAGIATCGAGEGPRPTAEEVPWNRTQLLAQFDRDRDEELQADEQQRAHAQFGGLDIPWLPPTAHDYLQWEPPSYWDEADVRRWDNVPEDNPITNAGATLGRVLFYDKQLSRNNSIACASCHSQQHGFADPARVSQGFGGGHTKRNSMGLAALRFTRLRDGAGGFFWDQRATSLEAQALMPIQDAVEMGMSLDQLEEKLAALPYYPPLFEWAYGSPEITSQRVARALAQFVRAMSATNTRFDRAAAEASSLADDFSQFTPEENLGKRLFLEGPDGVAEMSCAVCHEPPTFHMPTAFNIGLELEYDDPGLGGTEYPNTDPFTPSNEGKFRAPSLRNVELTAPYMHDGRFQTLEEVIDHYSVGIKDHPNLGVLIRDTDEEGRAGFHFTPAEKQALVSFLRTLTDTELASDPRFSDPFLRVKRNAAGEHASGDRN